jgi:hypothetical protein
MHQTAASLERRVQRLEAIARAEQAELLETAKWFFGLPLEEQLREWDSIQPELRAQGFSEVDLAQGREVLVTYYEVPLGELR